MISKRKTSPAPKGYLTQAQAVEKLTPFVSQSIHITQEREAGRLGLYGKDWTQSGNRFFYSEKQVADLLKQFISGQLKPVRHEKQEEAA